MVQPLTWAGTVVVTILLPTYLGDVNLGKLTFGLAFTRLFGLIGDLGVATYVMKETSRNPGASSSLISNALATRIPLSLVATALTVTIVNLSPYDPLSRSIVYVLCLGILVDALANVVYGGLQGLQKMRALALYGVVSKLGYVGLVVVILVAGGGPIEVAAGSVASALLGLVVISSSMLRRVPLVPCLDSKVWRAVLLGGLPFFTWQASLIVYGQVDTVLLSLLAHDAVVGWYAVAYRIVTIPVFLPTIIMTVISPALAAAATNPVAFNPIARRAVQIVALITTPMALGIMLLPDKVIQLLGFPEVFTNAIAPIVLLGLHIPLASVDTIIGTVLVARDRQRQWAMVGIAAAVLNPALNLLAIPYTQSAFDNGAIGAAAITTLTEVFMMLAGLRLLPAGVLDRSTVSDALTCLICGALMGVVVWFTRDAPLVIPVVLGALVYGGASLAFGAVSLHDLRLVQRHVFTWRRVASGAPM